MAEQTNQKPHMLVLERSFLADGVRAACSCGWSAGARQDSDEAARRDFDSHVAFVIGERA